MVFQFWLLIDMGNYYGCIKIQQSSPQSIVISIITYFYETSTNKTTNQIFCHLFGTETQFNENYLFLIWSRSSVFKIEFQNTFKSSQSIRFHFYGFIRAPSTYYQEFQLKRQKLGREWTSSKKDSTRRYLNFFHPLAPLIHRTSVFKCHKSHFLHLFSLWE